MEIIKKSKLFKSTWIGRAGEMYSLHFDKRRAGKRIVVHKWLDTNLYDIKLIDGDGRKIGFKSFIEYQDIQENEVENIIEKIKGEFLNEK